MSQWAEVVFQLREPSFLNGGVPHEGSLALMGWGFQKKSLNGGGGSTHHAPTTMGNPGSYMLQKNRIGRREVGFLIFFSLFCHCFFSYCLQRAYETLKQHLVKFKHSSHVLRS